jgi:hypothetical protein
MLCNYCGHAYAEFNYHTEIEHLLDCNIYQNLPIAEIRKSDGKIFIADRENPNILIERISREN